MRRRRRFQCVQCQEDQSQHCLIPDQFRENPLAAGPQKRGKSSTEGREDLIPLKG